MKKLDAFLLVLTLLLLGGIGLNKYLADKKKNDPSQQLEVQTFQVNDGWGYEIRVNDKRFIYQDQIPVITECRSFESEQHALLVGEKVLEKIRNRKNPSVTRKELIRWGILKE